MEGWKAKLFDGQLSVLWCVCNQTYTPWTLFWFSYSVVHSISSVGTSGCQLATTMMKLTMMIGKQISMRTWLSSKVTALGITCPGSTPVGFCGKQQASESRSSSSHLIMTVRVIVRKPHEMDGKTVSLDLCINTAWEQEKECSVSKFK